MADFLDDRSAPVNLNDHLMEYESADDEALAKAEADFLREQQLEKLTMTVLNRLDWCKQSTDRQNAEKRWLDCKNFWLGKQWDGIKSFGIKGRDAESKRLHPNPVDNYFKAHIEGLVGDITDKPVDIQVKAREAGDEDVARKMNNCAKYVWYINRGDRKLEFAARRGVLHGPLIAKVYWDNAWEGGPGNPFVGNVRWFVVPPPNLFVDPRVKATEERVIQQAEFLMYTVRRSLSYIRNAYPDQGGRVTADTYASYVTTLSDNEETYVDNDDAEALVIEYWYRGEPRAPEFPAGDREVTPQSGWVHKAVVAGNVLLEHRTYVYPWYPFVMEWIYPSDESIYGYGDGYDVLLPQLIINKLNELSIEGAAIQSHGNWVTEVGNIQQKSQFQKYAQMGGSILPVADIGRTQRVPGGNVPTTLFAHYRQELQAMETICGRYDVAQGRTPRNIQAASAIALLLQQSGGRVRQRARAVSSFVEQIIKMVVDLIGMNYTVDRIIRVEGENGAVSWETVSPQDLLRTKTWYDPLTGQQHMETYVPEMDVEVTAGTETPTSRVYYSELAMQLYQQGIIDDEALLDTLQFPRWREILARKKAAAQQAQAAPQSSPGLPGLPGLPGGVLQPGAAPGSGLGSPELAGVAGGEQMAQGAQVPFGGGGGSQNADLAALAMLINQLQQGGGR